MKTKMMYKGKGNSFLTYGVQGAFYVNIKGFGTHGSGQMTKMVVVTKDSKSHPLEVYTSLKLFLEEWEVL